MIGTLLDKINSLRTKRARQSSNDGPATAETPATLNPRLKSTTQFDTKGIHTDAFFFAGATEHLPAFDGALLQKTHPDGSSCGAGCGSS